MFLDIRILMKKTVIIMYVNETNRIAFRHKIRKMLDRPFFGYSLAIFFTMFYDVFDEGSNSAHLSEQLANVIKISEEPWKTTKQSFQNVKEHMEFLN